MLRESHSEENHSQEQLQVNQLKEDFKIELQTMNDAYKKSTCESNSWLTCFRTLTSIFAGEMASMSSYLVSHRALHGLSQETETLLLVASLIPGVISAYAVWWSTGEVEKCVNTRSNRINLDRMLDEINQIKSDHLVGYPVSTTQQSGMWSFFKSCSALHHGDYHLIPTEDDVENGIKNRGTC